MLVLYCSSNTFSSPPKFPAIYCTLLGASSPAGLMSALPSCNTVVDRLHFAGLQSSGPPGGHCMFRGLGIPLKIFRAAHIPAREGKSSGKFLPVSYLNWLPTYERTNVSMDPSV